MNVVKTVIQQATKKLDSDKARQLKTLLGEVVQSKREPEKKKHPAGHLSVWDRIENRIDGAQRAEKIKLLEREQSRSRERSQRSVSSARYSPERRHTSHRRRSPNSRNRSPHSRHSPSPSRDSSSSSRKSFDRFSNKHASPAHHHKNNKFPPHPFNKFTPRKKTPPKELVRVMKSVIDGTSKNDKDRKERHRNRSPNNSSRKHNHNSYSSSKQRSHSPRRSETRNSDRRSSPDTRYNDDWDIPGRNSIADEDECEQPMERVADRRNMARQMEVNSRANFVHYFHK